MAGYEVDPLLKRERDGGGKNPRPQTFWDDEGFCVMSVLVHTHVEHATSAQPNSISFTTFNQKLRRKTIS